MLVPRSFPLSCALLAALCAVPGLPLAEAAPRIHCQTAYLGVPVAGAHQVRLQGELGGAASLTRDGNICTVDAFGDPAVCTEIAFPAIDVALEPLRLADPTGAGRRLFRIRGEGLPEGTTWTLVVPRRRSEPHRLIVDEGEDRRRVLTLEARPRPEAPDTAPAPELSQATYTALRAGAKVMLRATGQHPTAGFKTYFEQLPIRIHPPQFRLLHVRPAGMAATVMTDFSVETSFEAPNPVKAVIVHDAKGKHVVPVKGEG